MPEGHTVHRIALQLRADFVGRAVRVSSPQGRFSAGAALLDGRTMTGAHAVGKHLFAAFGEGPGTLPSVGEPVDGAPSVGDRGDERWLRVHLGLYGAWDLHGEVSALSSGVEAVGSMGAPRRRRAVRMGEGERALPGEDEPAAFPPDPVGQVRVRLMTATTLADLRGPTACEVLRPDEVAAVIAAAGPDPRVHVWADPEAEFVERLTRRRVPVGVLLMDQSVVSGIGNIYRAEMLFRARLDPYTPGVRVPADAARALWQDWVLLLEDGVRVGAMITREDLDEAGRAQALADSSLRHAVYGRDGLPCLRCGATVASAEMAGRRLFWCPGCQV